MQVTEDDQLADVKSRLATVLPRISEQLGERTHRGEVVQYIAPLARIDPAKFGMAVILADNSVHMVGDAEEGFSIQSISKVFSLTLALGKLGDGLWHRVGREPSGDAFNSIVLLEHEKGIPRNPFINAGAIVTADVLLASHEPKETIGEILRFVQFLAEDADVSIDRVVAQAETATGFGNFALANLLKANGNLHNLPDQVLGVYHHQCSIAMSCRQLAQAGAFLVSNGRNPVNGFQIVAPERARRINALMMTCGHYNGSGDFAFRVGVPAKSGVGGGVLAIVPRIASIAVWSPGLNQNGNSLLGTEALEMLCKEMCWAVF